MSMGFAVACSRFFGKKPGQNLQGVELAGLQ
jgi:hypothetical protein